jgi:hypothetical protein
MPQCVNGFLFAPASPYGVAASVAASSGPGVGAEIGAGLGALALIVILNAIDIAVQKASGRGVLLL